jgi:DNA-directed RNA polymerase subunit H (RpoH/RPB5)
MSTSFELIDQLYRSRQTILQILRDRGYNTKPYENFGPGEIEAMLVATASNTKDKDRGSAFRIDVERISEEGSKWTDSSIRKCRVIYAFNRLKNRVGPFVANLINGDEDTITPADTEVIVILALPEGEPVADAFHGIAYSSWTAHKLRISFFRLANLVIHPAEHVLVPKHEFIPKREAEKLFTPTERMKLPFIRFHEDMQARILGLVPADIVKITRPSPSAGEYTIYRICA